MSRRVFHVVVPNFYAEIERSLDPSAKDRPLLVGGDPRKGGTVQSATPDAVGVTAGMLMWEALEQCPNARVRRTDMRRYRTHSERLFTCIRQHCERLEEAELSAGYFEASGVSEALPALGERIRASVRAELDLPLCVGIAPTKFVARIASENAGGDGVVEIAPEALNHFLHPLPVSRLDGVGAKTAAILAGEGIHTVGELAALGRGRTQSLLGIRGLDLLAQAQGRDDSPVRASKHAKSLSQETTLAGEEIDTGVLADRLLELATSLEKRLSLRGLTARRVTLKVRFAEPGANTRSRILPQPVASAAEIYAEAVRLMRRTQAGERGVRLLGLVLSELSPERSTDRQLDLFSPPS